MKSEKVRITHEEYVSGKYKTTYTGTESDPHSATSARTYHEALVYYNDDGSIDESMTYRRENKEKEKEKKKEKKKEKNKREKNNKEGCLAKIIKAPFRLLWWLVKQCLVIVSLGMLNEWLNDKK